MEYLILVGLIVAAFKTKPDAPSFRVYLKNSVPKSHTSSGPRWLDKVAKVITGEPSLPDFKVEDLILCSLATLDDGKLFIGIFGAWFFLSEGSRPAGSASRLPTDGADAERERAVKLKGQRNPAGAAKAFLKAAKMYEQGEDSFEAGKCYDDAHSSFNQSKDTRAAMDALSHAARLFEKDGRSISRAGRAYDTLGGRALAEGDLVGALAHFTKARDAFERGSDGRAMSATIQIADINASLGHFSIARSLYERLAEQCVDTEGDWVKVKMLLADYARKYPAFDADRGYFLLTNLIAAHEYAEPAQFAKAFEELERGVILPTWALPSLKKMKQELEAGDISFT